LYPLQYHKLAGHVIEPEKVWAKNVGGGQMVDKLGRLRAAVQKITEAIWNLDQLEPLSPEMRVQYDGLQAIRAEIMKLLKENTQQ